MSEEGLKMEKKVWGEMGEVWRKVSPELATTLGATA